MQELLVDAPEGPQVGPERRPRSLTGITMDLALAITIVIPRPFAHTMGNRGMVRMAVTIALPFVGIEPRATRQHVVGNEGVAGLPVRVVADPKSLLTRVLSSC